MKTKNDYRISEQNLYGVLHVYVIAKSASRVGPLVRATKCFTGRGARVRAERFLVNLEGK